MYRSNILVFILLYVTLTFTSCDSQRTYQEQPVIPLATLFSLPGKFSIRLSPDGSKTAYLREVDGSRNIRIKSIHNDDESLLTEFNDNFIINFFWAYDNEHIVFLRRSLENENRQLFSVSLSGDIDTLTSPDRYLKIIAIEPDFPDQIIVQTSSQSNIYQISLTDNSKKLIFENNLDAKHFIVDHKFRIRIAVIGSHRGEMALMHRKDDESEWEYLIDWYKEDQFGTFPIGFGDDNETLYMFSCIGTPTSELRQINVLTGEEETIYSDPDLDLESVIFNPETFAPQAVHNSDASSGWKIIDKSFGSHLKKLRALNGGFFELSGRTFKWNYITNYRFGSTLTPNSHFNWLVAHIPDDASPFYSLYNSRTREIIQSSSVNVELDRYTLSNMKPVRIESRDGLDLNCLLTIPVGKKPDKLPTVIYIHGGPRASSKQTFNPTIQWLANRGYAVLMVNFRGSTGFGKKFIEAADKEYFGGKVQDDITDATYWVINKGIADPDRIALFGASYGGFAVLCGLVKEPELYACGVNLFGSSGFGHTDYISSTHDEEQKARLPILNAAKIKAPVFIAHGLHDARVSIQESYQMVDSLKSFGKEVEFLVFDNEGHGISNLENRIEFYSKAEKFLSKYLGGRFE